MGVRIHVYLSHDLRKWNDPNEAVTRLEPSIPSTLAVRDYWDTVAPSNPDPQPVDRWVPEPVSPRPPQYRIYSAPGSLWLQVTPNAARIFTGGRWRGFLEIEPLRMVHLQAFNAIADCLHSKALVLCADVCDEPYDAFWAGGSQHDCADALTSTIGPPQRSIDPDTVARLSGVKEPVWFLLE